MTPKTVGFKTADEPWVEYRLEDGSVLRVRFILTAVQRLDGKFTPDGKPVYNFSSQMVHHIDIDPKLVENRAAQHHTVQ